MNDFHRLDWDSAFFGREIGANSAAIGDQVIAIPRQFDSIVISSDELIPALEKKGIFKDVKLTFAKSPRRRKVGMDLTSPIEVTPHLTKLFNSSGMYSRFKLDPIFAPQFARFYRAWLSNAIKGIFDDSIHCSGKLEKPSGVLTLKKQGGAMVISIIAVDSDSRGSGIGADLVAYSENMAIEQGCSQLRVATQGRNVLAQKFYLKNGFELVEEKIIYHMHQVK